MKRHPLSTRAMKSAGYDPTCSVLEVEHNNNRVEQFLGVPAQTWQGFLMSHDQEDYFKKHIANSFFKVVAGYSA